MSDLTKEDLLEVLREVLGSHKLPDDMTHEKHHDFIKMEIERRKRNKERWEKFQSSFIGGLAMGILAMLGWLGTLVINWIRHGSHTP